MADKAKVVLTDYVSETLDIEHEMLGELADIVALQVKTPDEFLAEAEDCDALLNTYAGPITAEAMARMHSTDGSRMSRGHIPARRRQGERAGRR